MTASRSSRKRRSNRRMGIGAFLGASIGAAFGLKNEYLVVTLPVGFLLSLLLGSEADSIETKSGAVGPAVAVSTGVALLSYFAGAAFLLRGFVLVLPLWGGFAFGRRVYNGLRPVRRLGAVGRGSADVRQAPLGPWRSWACSLALRRVSP